MACMPSKYVVDKSMNSGDPAQVAAMCVKIMGSGEKSCVSSIHLESHSNKT